MSPFLIGLFHITAEALWAMLAKLATRAFMDKLLSKLVLAGLERLAKSTANDVDDQIVADVREALTKQ